jgi:hypothetical protein
MKQIITTLLTAFIATCTFGQRIVSGDYGDGLKLAYDSATKKVTGYFENYTGTNQQFSCIFYIEGTAAGKKFAINTYYPEDKKEDQIQGSMEISNEKEVKIKLPAEHGGCWNVMHFADAPVTFTLQEKQSLKQIRYVNVAKAFFYSEKSEDKRLKAYLVNGNIICVEQTEGEWAYCAYYGKKTTKGWVKIAELNKL